MPRKKKRRDRSRDPRVSRWTDNPFGPIEKDAEEDTTTPTRWTDYPFGPVYRDGVEVYNPHPPNQRVRMRRIFRAWSIQDPEKRTRELVELGLYPESALDEFKD